MLPMSVGWGIFLIRTTVRIPSKSVYKKLKRKLVPQMAQSKLTRRGRNVVRALTVGSLLVVIGAGFSAVGNASEKTVASTPKTSGYIRVVVAPGESLWSVAAMVAGNRDVNSVLDEIVQANALASTDVAAGTRLLVPTK
jgi:LysM domain